MTSISTLGQALDQMERLTNLQTQMSTLEGQISTGHKGNTFEDLGTGSNGTLGDIRARVASSSLTTYINNITIADRRIGLMTNALSEFKAQGNNLVQGLVDTPQDGATANITNLSNQADTVQTFLQSLVNTQDGDRYLFSGGDASTQPLGSTSSMDTYEQAQIQGWMNGTVSTDQLIQSYTDPTKLTDATVGYSAALSSGSAKNVTVSVDNNTALDYTSLGNQSPIRDALAAVSMIKNLCAQVKTITTDQTNPSGTNTPPGASPTAQSANFYKVLNNLQTMLGNALDKIDQSNQNLSQTQAEMDTISSDHKTDQATLDGTITDIENVDMNEAAVKVTALQTQLEASYRVTATLGQLSLVNYLSS